MESSRRAAAPLVLLLAAACGGHADRGTAAADSAFQDVQRRGAVVMGVDQEASSHVFEDLPDGGRIVFTMNDPADSAGAAIIRGHLRAVADSFRAGIFSAPALVHAQEVPGTGTMTRLTEQIRYTYADRAAGGELRLTTASPEALAAIHDFLAFQRLDHRAAGHEGGEHQH